MQNAELKQALDAARRRTDELFGLVRPDSLYERPIPERHRIIFYLGHLEAFDWNLVCRGALDMPVLHSEFDELFSFGIDPGAGNLPQDQPSDWPGAAHVTQYNTRVRSELDAALERVPGQLLHVAIEHRLMHAETLAYMLHNLPVERKVADRRPAAEIRPEPRPPQMVEIPAGPVILGRREGDGFGWDNEFQAHSVAVKAFEISKYKVTNGEYLEFVREGARPPHFWVLRDGEWFYRGMFGEVPLPLDWPVYLTHEEARAYAAWKGQALPTEAQFQRAAYGSPQGEERDPDPSGANLDFRRWDPVSVYTGGENAWGLCQAIGNGWEWTSTVFEPFPGFRPLEFYPGYSAPFFDGEHYVLKGASPRTAACFLRRSFRNWFRPGYPYVYGTARLVAN